MQTWPLRYLIINDEIYIFDWFVIQVDMINITDWLCTVLCWLVYDILCSEDSTIGNDTW